jgi:regulatory protein
MASSTEKRLERYVASYLKRQWTSRGHLRLLMLRFLRKIGEEERRDLVDPLLDQVERLGLVNDEQYARDKARSLHRKGSSPALIRAKLYEKRLSQDHINSAIDALGDGAAMEAARAYARKRRLGAWGTKADDREQRQKDLAKLARRGFSYDVALAALEGDDDF